MNPVAAKPRPTPVQSRRLLTVIVGIAAGVAAFMAVASALRLPPHIGTVVMSNPHEWHVDVQVTSPHRKGSLPMGCVERNTTKSFGEVLDHGDTWVFQFSYGEVGGGRLVTSRSDLQRAQWKITIPDECAQRMHKAGASPSFPSC